jgi:hypothetical protein
MGDNPRSYSVVTTVLFGDRSATFSLHPSGMPPAAAITDIHIHFGSLTTSDSYDLTAEQRIAFAAATAHKPLVVTINGLTNGRTYKGFVMVAFTDRTTVTGTFPAFTPAAPPSKPSLIAIPTSQTSVHFKLNPPEFTNGDAKIRYLFAWFGDNGDAVHQEFDTDIDAKTGKPLPVEFDLPDLTNMVVHRYILEAVNDAGISEPDFGTFTPTDTTDKPVLNSTNVVVGLDKLLINGVAPTNANVYNIVGAVLQAVSGTGANQLTELLYYKLNADLSFSPTPAMPTGAGYSFDVNVHPNFDLLFTPLKNVVYTISVAFINVNGLGTYSPTSAAFLVAAPSAFRNIKFDSESSPDNNGLIKAIFSMDAPLNNWHKDNTEVDFALLSSVVADGKVAALDSAFTQYAATIGVTKPSRSALYSAIQTVLNTNSTLASFNAASSAYKNSLPVGISNAVISYLTTTENVARQTAGEIPDAPTTVSGNGPYFIQTFGYPSGTKITAGVVARVALNGTNATGPEAIASAIVNNKNSNPALDALTISASVSDILVNVPAIKNMGGYVYDPKQSKLIVSASNAASMVFFLDIYPNILHLDSFGTPDFTENISLKGLGIPITNGVTYNAALTLAFTEQSDNSTHTAGTASPTLLFTTAPSAPVMSFQMVPPARTDSVGKIIQQFNMPTDSDLGFNSFSSQTTVVVPASSVPSNPTQKQLSDLVSAALQSNVFRTTTRVPYVDQDNKTSSTLDAAVQITPLTFGTAVKLISYFETTNGGQNVTPTYVSSQSFTPYGFPSGPQNVVLKNAANGAQSGLVAGWEAPVTDGYSNGEGANITSYIATLIGPNNQSVGTPVTVTAPINGKFVATFSGMILGQSYKASIVAINASGLSSIAAVSTSVVAAIAATVTSVSIIGGNTIQAQLALNGAVIKNAVLLYELSNGENSIQKLEQNQLINPINYQVSGLAPGVTIIAAIAIIIDDQGSVALGTTPGFAPKQN